MTYRIVHALKRLAVSSAIRFMTAERVCPENPEPRRRDIDERLPDVERDGWLFDGPELPISPQVAALSGELNRVSESLSCLRRLLSEISSTAPIVAEYSVAFEQGFAVAPLWSEDLLFEGEPQLVPFVRSANAGEAAFLFENDFAPVGWNALEGIRVEPMQAA